MSKTPFEPKAHDLQRVLARLSEMDFHTLADFNQGSAGVYWCSQGTSPWEMHPNDEELLFVLDGEVEITVMTEAGPKSTVAGPSCAFVVPRGHWHKQRVLKPLKQLYVTPGATEHSDKEDPR
jgi:uncharacterized cupin superfamily protein